jgi:hypothetical protein
MTLQNNPLNCECPNSFYTNQWSGSLTQIATTSGLDSRQLIFAATCQTSSNTANLGRSVINFGAVSTCDPGTVLTNCPTTTPKPTTSTTTRTTQTTLSLEAGNAIGVPEAQLGVSPVSIDLYQGYVAGITLGFLGALLILCILVYCISPIEFQALCFNLIPCFYRWCPCKRNHRREKEFDLFISFNKKNEKWVRSKLIPFIKGKLVNKLFVIHLT